MKISRKTIAISILFVFFALLAVTLFIQIKKAGEISESALIKPRSITVGHSLDKGTIVKLIHAAQLYYTFWDTGEYKYLNAVISPQFIDHTPFQGQSQGMDGLKTASNQLRAAIPDLRCSIEDLLITGDMMTARLNFTGTSKRDFLGHPSTGKPIAFTGIDILRVKDGKIIETWHVADNLAFLQQLKILNLKQA